MNNKYSLNAESYDLTKLEWKAIKEDVIKNSLSNDSVSEKYELNDKQVWFLYDKLLQEKYNHLYKRQKLTNPKQGDFVYCDYDGFGRGKIIGFSNDNTIMIVKFDSLPLGAFCCAKSMVTIFDDVKRKITKL